MKSILYLVHDVNDAAVQKRVRMMSAGGVCVKVMGFRRGDKPLNNIHDAEVIDLGQTYNANFIQRITSVLKIVLSISKYKSDFEKCDALVSRNLEMLAIAVRGRAKNQKNIPLVYESLDIHRLLLNKSVVGKILRKLESWLCSRASRLWTSSPAFISQYFETISSIQLPITLVENKVFDPDSSLTPHTPNMAVNRPWKIGWFGAIRCRKSLDILKNIVRNSNGEIEVIIRGRVSYDQFDDFDKTIADTDGLHFFGAYKNPDDLANIYGEVHFNWAIDMFEEGLNSSWLLPNRLYEGGLMNCVPLADKTVQTGKVLNEKNIGITFDGISLDQLTNFFEQLTDEQYQDLKKRSESVDRLQWVDEEQTCRKLIEEIFSCPA